MARTMRAVDKKKDQKTAFFHTRKLQSESRKSDVGRQHVVCKDEEAYTHASGIDSSCSASVAALAASTACDRT